ncbi:MAG: ATP-binding protein [Planctomycetota bacterium]
MTPGSLAGRLVRGVLTGLALLLVATGAVLYFGARHLLETQLDEDLTQRAAALCSVLHLDAAKLEYQTLEVEHELGAIELEFEYNPALMPEYVDREPAWYFEVRDANGACLFRSASSRGADLAFVTTTRERVLGDLRTPDGRAGRAIAVSHEPVREHLERIDYSKYRLPAPMPLTVVVASGREMVDAPLRSVAIAIGVAFMFFGLGSVVLVRRTVRGGLVPLASLTQELESIGPESLDRRVGHAGLPTELAPLAQHTNAMLDRIHTGMERERVFTTSVAHELRTPIAELRTGSEVALRGAASREDLLASVRTSLDVAKEMEDVVEALLFLRRVESGRAAPTLERVDVTSIVRDELDATAPLRAKRRVELESSLAAGLRARTNPALLSLVARNLLANASEYAPEGTHVRVDARANGDAVELSVSNPAAGLTADDLRNLGMPFWRKEHARTASAHAGLGVSVVKGACRALGIDVTFELESDEFVVRLRIPG